MHGRHFLSLKELSTASTQMIRQMKTSCLSVFDGTVKLSRCWNVVIEEHEDYIKG